MRIRSFVVPMLVLASFWCDTALAYKIHAQKDTVFVHAKRGFWGQPSNLDVISSRRGEDTGDLPKTRMGHNSSIFIRRFGVLVECGLGNGADAVPR